MTEMSETTSLNPHHSRREVDAMRDRNWVARCPLGLGSTRCEKFRKP